MIVDKDWEMLASRETVVPGDVLRGVHVPVVAVDSPANDPGPIVELCGGCVGPTGAPLENCCLITWDVAIRSIIATFILLLLLAKLEFGVGKWQIEVAQPLFG